MFTTKAAKVQKFRKPSFSVCGLRFIASERHHARSAINTIQAERSVVMVVRTCGISILERCDRLSWMTEAV